MADDRSIRVRLIADIATYRQGMAQAGAVTKGFAAEVSGSGKTVRADVEKVGRSALIMSAGMTFALAGAAKAAMDWESAWAGVTKTVSGSPEQMDQLEASLRKLSTRLPATHEEIAGVAEAAGQLGIERSAIADFTETMIALGVSTDLSADQAATAIAQMMNVMGTRQSDVDRFGASLVALGNVGASTESQILDMAQRLAGGGKLIGLSEADVLGLANAMSSMGIEAELGGGAMQRTFLKMYTAVKSGGSNLENFAKIAGTSASDFARKFETHPVEAVEALIAGLNRLDAAGQDVTAALASVGIKGTQDLNVLLRLKGANDLTADSVKLANKAWKENVALHQEAEKRYGTTESKMKILGNEVNEIAIDLGDQFLPAIKGAVDALGGMLRFFEELPGPVKAGAGILIGLGATVTGVVGIFGTMAPKIRELDKALQSMGLGADFASTNLKRIATLATKGGLLVGALYAVGTALDAAFDEDHRGNIDKIESSLIKLGRGATLASAGLDLERISGALKDIDKNDNWGHNFLNSVVHLGGLLGEAGDQVDAAKEKIDGLDKALTHIAEVDPDVAAAALEAIHDALGDDAFNQLLPMLDDYAVAVAAAGNANELAAGQMDKMTNAAGVSKKQIDDLDKAIDNLFDTLFGVEDAADAFQTGLNDLDDTIKAARESGLDMNHVLDGTSDGAIQLRGALRETVKSAAELVQQWIEAGVTGDDLQGRIAGLSDKFMDQATKLGIPKDAAQHYLDLLLQFPTNVVTSFTQQGIAEVTATIEKLMGLLNQRGMFAAEERENRGRSNGGGSAPVGTDFSKQPAMHHSAGGWAGAGRMGIGPSGRDQILSYLDPDEFVLRPEATRALGGPTLRRLNSLTPGAPMGAMFHGYGSQHQVAGSSASTIHNNTTVVLNVAGSVHSKESLRKEMVEGLRYESRRVGGPDKLFGRN